MVVAPEELSWGSLGVGGSLITRPEILTRAIVQGGTEEQKRRWLPGIARGELMVGVMVTEPDYGSDVAHIKVTATPTEGGYLISGVKTWATFAGRANVLMLLARTDADRTSGHRGLSLFVVEKEPAAGHAFAFEQPGGGKVEGRAIDTLGYRGMHSYEVAFDDARRMAKGEGALQASMVKAYVCRAAEWVTREAMQLHGGMGYAEEFPVSRYFVDARVLSIFEGADETLCLRVIARRLAEQALERVGV